MTDGAADPADPAGPTAPAGPAPAGGSVLHRWVVSLAEELGVDPDALDIDLVLDLARDVAHTVARPAVPLTTFLLGMAVATGGGDRTALETASLRVAEMADLWARDEAAGGAGAPAGGTADSGADGAAGGPA